MMTEDSERKQAFIPLGVDESRLTMMCRYMNFAHGDESLEEIYGQSLPRLRELKQQWDPQGVFNQWFPIV